MRKKFFKKTLFIIFLFLLVIGSFNFIIDPFFYFHNPITTLNYNLDYFEYNTFEKNVKLTGTYQRYTNYRLSQLYQEEVIIIGTSMTENFKIELVKKFFNKNAIKLPYSGASFSEINKELEKILRNSKRAELIIRGLDYGKILDKKDSGAYIPEYLSENRIVSKDTIKYLINLKTLERGKDILYNTYMQGKRKFNFDTYSNWDKQVKYGKKYVLNGQNSILTPYIRATKEKEEKILTEQEKVEIIKNIEENVIALSKEYPQKKFIYFITPYSIVYWDSLNQKGAILKQLEAEKIMIEMILEIPNIELYSFFNNYDLIKNLNNYRDTSHYKGKINDKILEWISRKEYRLTKENYKKYLEENKEFYLNYDYDKIFQ